MKFIAGFIASTFFLAFFTKAYSIDTLNTTPNGIKYKIYNEQSGKKIHLNNIITFNLIEKTEKDSILFSSYDRDNPLRAQIIPSRNITDFMDVFILLYEKDSVLIQIPTDVIFKNREYERPKFLSKGSNLIFLIKIEEVQTVEEAIAEEEKALDKERSLLAKYLLDNKLSPHFTSSGLIFIIKKSTKNMRPAPRDTVLINYTASTVGGKAFDSSVKSEAVKARLVQPGREYVPIKVIVAGTGIITAWDEGLLLLAEGSSATLIIPSHLAFGAMGYADLIEPYTTLLVDIELIKINKATNEDAKYQKQKYVTSVPQYRPKPVINSLTSFMLLINNENVKNSNFDRKYSPASNPTFSIKWFDILNQFIKR
ncbi:FKBP-type peptidyl-prolyl cis-trans isomerase [Pedobacter sp. P351]|uniref:FKBP-type peptidyl-prolyl cis-trans isomerase n=1 Tax=Pedobacter superstes TaxID=3133441 RepID=UPI0030A4ED69